MESPVGYHLFATENSLTDPALKGHNNNASGLAVHSDGKLKVDGDSDLNGNLDVSGTLHSDTLVASSGSLVEVANVIHGSVNLGDGQYADSIVKTLCPLHCNGFIDTISSVPLRLGQSHQNNANSIELGRTGIYTLVRGPLSLDDILDLHKYLDGAVMVVDNTSTNSSSVGISATGRTALQAHGNVTIDSDKALTLDGTTAQNFMRYNSTQSRMEFYIGGNLVFIIDANGGHNP